MDAIFNFIRALPSNPWGVVLLLVLFALGLAGAGLIAWADRSDHR